MTKEIVSKTVGEVLADSKAGPRERSAARATIRAVSLLQEALSASGRTQHELAKELGVSDGRVSQVLKGDGNIYVTTLARYLRAMGYELDLAASAADEALPQIGIRRHRRRADADVANVYVGSFGEDQERGYQMVITSQDNRAFEADRQGFRLRATVGLREFQNFVRNVEPMVIREERLTSV
ncbi:MAG: helix-turn-helix transcriptional regulator [Scrofimicrobium sp.]